MQSWLSCSCDEAADRAEIVAEMEVAGRLDAGKDERLEAGHSCSRGLWRAVSHAAKVLADGALMDEARAPDQASVRRSRSRVREPSALRLSRPCPARCARDGSVSPTSGFSAAGSMSARIAKTSDPPTVAASTGKELRPHAGIERQHVEQRRDDDRLVDDVEREDLAVEPGERRAAAVEVERGEADAGQDRRPGEREQQ